LIWGLIQSSFVFYFSNEREQTVNKYNSAKTFNAQKEKEQEEDKKWARSNLSPEEKLARDTEVEKLDEWIYLFLKF